MKISRPAVIVILILLAIYHLALPIIRLPFKIEIDHNEGWNAIFSQKAMSGKRLYNQPTPWVMLNYPPFSFYLVGALGRILGDMLLAGRCVSLLSLFAVAVLTAVIVAGQSGNHYASVFAGCLCLASFAVFATHYVGMNDPEMLGHLLTLGALLVYVRGASRPERSKAIFAVALLASLGIFIKHSIVALPLAISLDLLIASRKRFLQWTGIGLLTVGGLTLVSFLIGGRGFFVQVLGYPRTYSPTRMLLATALFVLACGLTLLVLLPWLRRRMKTPPARVAGLYLGLGMVLGIVMSGGRGVDVNVFFDANIALSLLAGLFLAESAAAPAPPFLRRKALAPLLPLVLLVSLIGVSALKVAQPGGPWNCQIGSWRPGILSELRRFERETLDDASFLRQAQGPVVCESSLLCYLSKEEYVFDVFFVREAVHKGKIAESEILKKIDSGHFAAIQLESDITREARAFGLSEFLSRTLQQDRLTEGMKKSIAERYRIVRRSANGAFFVPAAAPPSSAAHAFGQVGDD